MQKRTASENAGSWLSGLYGIVKAFNFKGSTTAFVGLEEGSTGGFCAERVGLVVWGFGFAIEATQGPTFGNSTQRALA